jgi:hypothetical protein
LDRVFIFGSPEMRYLFGVNLLLSLLEAAGRGLGGGGEVVLLDLGQGVGDRVCLVHQLNVLVHKALFQPRHEVRRGEIDQVVPVLHAD